MLEIRIHGRGGQGAVVASQIMAYAFFLEGMYSQSFPTFGAERRGAPVAAFVRVDDKFINLRSQVTSPAHVLVLSAKLAETVSVNSGLQPDGVILINSDQPADRYSFLKEENCRVLTVDAGGIALKHGLGDSIMPLVNAPMLGAFAGATSLLTKDSLVQALPRFIPSSLEQNKDALLEAYTSAKNLV